MVKFANLDDMALAFATRVLWVIKPTLFNKVVIAMEKVNPEDRSLVFHLQDENDIEETFIISNEYFIEVVNEFASYYRNGDKRNSSLSSS